MDIVSTYFDGNRAVALRSDGTTASADSYDPGPNGFVVARCLLDKRTQELEFVNSCSVGGQLVIPRASASDLETTSQSHARGPRAGGRTRGGGRRGGRGRGGYAAAGIEIKRDRSSLKLAAGHRGSMTIVAKSTGKDKVQICQITETLCPRLQLESKRSGAACAQHHIETSLQSFDDSCRHIASFARGQGTGKKRS